MSNKNSFLVFGIVTMLAVTVYSCKNFYLDHGFRQTYADVNEAIHSDSSNIQMFKVHLKNGNVCLLDEWDLNVSQDTLIGIGRTYDFNRNLLTKGDVVLNVDDIAIIETNQLEKIKSKDKARLAGLGILTSMNIALDIVCITQPKACYGSCPTFYVDGKEMVHSANAEGFSSSISPCLEKRDLDALQYQTASNTFFLTMKNEAYETHMLNQLYIDAVPKKKKEKVFHDQTGQYYASQNLYHPKSAWVDNKNIKDALYRMDESEYFSVTDSFDLAAKEEIILDFNNLPDTELGIVINYRQTLLTTFLLYSGLSYMGDEVGDYFTKIETNNQIKKRLGNPFRKLGKIKFYVWDNGYQKWTYVDELYETGPIAKNLLLASILKKRAKNGSLKLKIEMAKGMWRLDYVGLTTIEAPINLLTIQPSSIEVIDGEDYTIDEVKSDDKDYLVSFPGNEFVFQFDLPEISEDQDYELFLSSKGYYLEWMREDWIRGKNIPKLKKMLTNDAQTWKELATEFKSIESEMEAIFWNSKYSRMQ